MHPDQVVLLGLNIVLPLISLELLKFPKLCHLYFTLLSYILEVYTDQARVAGRGRGISRAQAKVDMRPWPPACNPEQVAGPPARQHPHTYCTRAGWPPHP